jgi:hypothetical protein
LQYGAAVLVGVLGRRQAGAGRDQPGISSMGKLMALALVCTLAAAVLFQPALMGPPRGDNARRVA